MKAVIVDDEIMGAETLQMLLEKFCPEVQIQALIHHAPDAAQKIRELKPDLIFLDIEMPFQSGFDILEKIQDLNFCLIFTTAYDNYALQAVRQSAVDYLLKPVDSDELIAAVQKAKRRNPIHLNQSIDLLIAQLRSENPLKRLAIPNHDSILFIDCAQILYLEADSNYTHIYSAGGKKHTVSRTLKEYDDQLDKKVFFRVHNTFLINLNHVEKYLKGDGGYVIMSNGASIDVSRRRKIDLLHLLSGTYPVQK